MSEMTTDVPVIDPEEMRDSAKRFLTDNVDRRAPYAEPPQGGADKLFASMAELGWTLLTVPQDMDGLGQSFSALAPVYEEMGKAVSPVALFPSLAALEVLTLPDATADAHSLAAQVAAGEAHVAVAIVAPEALSVSGGQVSAVLTTIPADAGATHLLLMVEGDAPAIWLIDLSATGVDVERPEMWDRSRPVIDVSLKGAAAKAVLDAGAAGAIDRVRGHIDLALAWDSLGGARQSLEETVAYMLTRQQFGRPIGSFQALKHRAADHKVAIEVATVLTREATLAFALGEQGSVDQACQARLMANETYHAMAEDAVQLHGGIGFTWEHDCHLFLKRAWLNEILYGTPDSRRDRLAPVLFARASRGRD